MIATCVHSFTHTKMCNERIEINKSANQLYRLKNVIFINQNESYGTNAAGASEAKLDILGSKL